MVRRRRRSSVSQLLEGSNTVVEPHDLRSKFHLDVRRGLSGLRDLRLLIAQLLELEALGSSSRGRRDPVTDSCATAADSESAAEDGTSPSSMGTSLMSDP
ncbi:hypothetical protein PI124_g24709 [Phytophthora idaei]|nr:hypothetical protein PI125_g27163 [Phytophthora idaei]KAG3112105.1 hypothetical protein PI126_g24793 [Phytophthora idaei]KAG3230192.1 hypothetical protein PI124_g24709 [Phytophthora idaei]